MSLTPLVLLTGFLGAGKTTTLNRLLAAPTAPRIAVLVNDLGRVNIDRRLIKSQSGDLVELTGGCVCCKIDLQKDLFTSVWELLDRAQPAYVILETTGIAEPDLLLRALGEQPAPRVVCTGVVTVVDCAALPEQLARHPEVKVQLEAADRVLLTKLDLVDAAQLSEVHQRLLRVNPAAEVASFPEGEEGSRGLVEFLTAARRCNTLVEARRTPHQHGQLGAVTFVEARPLAERETVKLLDELAPLLVRAKGPVAFAGRTQRRFFEKAGTQVSWRDYAEDRQGLGGGTELVLIGEGLDEATIRRRLWALASGA